MSRPGINRYGRVSYSNSMLGNAARHGLDGEVTRDTLPDIIAGCHWCNTVVGRCHGGEPECWHVAMLNGTRARAASLGAARLRFVVARRECRCAAKLDSRRRECDGESAGVDSYLRVLQGRHQGGRDQVQALWVAP